MKLLIQRTSEPGRLISDAEIRDIKEMLLGLEEVEIPEEDPEIDEELEIEDETEIEDVSASENKDKYVLELNVPGFKKEDFNIKVSADGILSVNARAELESFEAYNLTRSLKKRDNAFSSLFRLPEDANNNDVEARYENDVLTLSIGKL